MKKYIVIIFLLSFFACLQNNEQKLKYIGLSFSNESFDTLSFISTFENGNKSTLDWVLKIKNGHVLESGKFLNGVKTGLWNYTSSNANESIIVNWEQIKIDSFIITKPLDWEVKKGNNDSINCISFYNRSNDSIKILLKQYPKKQYNSSIGYLENKLSTTFDKYNFCRHVTYRFNIDKKSCLFSTIFVNENNPDQIELVLISENLNFIYECSLITQHRYKWSEELILFEIFRNLEINGEKLFPYFGEKFSQDFLKS